MTARPQMVGDTFADAIVWHWDRVKMMFSAVHDGTALHVTFKKVGGRWSKTLPSGKPNKSGARSYWTIAICLPQTYFAQSTDHFPTAEAAKAAAVEWYVKSLRGRALLRGTP